MTKTRLYRVTTKTATRLIEAANPQRAISHAARTDFVVDIPASHEVFNLAKKGVEIEVAGAQEQDEATDPTLI